MNTCGGCGAMAALGLRVEKQAKRAAKVCISHWSQVGNLASRRM